MTEHLNTIYNFLLLTTHTMYNSSSYVITAKDLNIRHPSIYNIHNIRELSYIFVPYRV